jgi:hypothetical protein
MSRALSVLFAEWMKRLSVVKLHPFPLPWHFYIHATFHHASSSPQRHCAMPSFALYFRNVCHHHETKHAPGISHDRTTANMQQM